MKKMTALLIALLLTLAAVCALAKTDGDYEYALRRDGTAKITSYKGTDTILVIPDTLGGRTVTGIERDAFRDCAMLTEVTLPGTVVYMGSNPFRGCLSLEAIRIAGKSRNYSVQDGVLFTSDGHQLISYPLGMEGTAYAVPAGTRNIGPGAFCGSHLQSVSLPDSTAFIGTDAFRDCAMLTEIALPETLTEIGAGAFRGCLSLTRLNLPAGMTQIGANAFRSCGALTEMRVPETVTSIGSKAFYGCGVLTLTVKTGSRAARYAKANGISCREE